MDADSNGAGLFTGLVTRAVYDHLLACARALGPVGVEPKKTCVHFVRRSAFLGVHPRKNGVLVTFKSPERIESARVVKAQQTSRTRWYVDVKLEDVDDIDAEFRTWMRESYELCG